MSHIIELLFTWLLVIAGWIVVAAQAAAAAQRTEARAKLSQIIDRVHAIELLAVRYYGAADRSDAARNDAAGIKLEFQRLSEDLRVYRAMRVASYDPDIVVDFYEAATGGDFEQTERSNVAHPGSLEVRRHAAASRLATHLEEEFYNSVGTTALNRIVGISAMLRGQFRRPK